MQKILVECSNNKDDDDDGNGSESPATNPICEEKICYTRTDQPLLIPEFNPLTLNVGIQCCITAKTFVNAETQTDDCYLRQLGNTINIESCYPESPSTNHHLLDHNYYADHQHFFDEPIIVSKPTLQTNLPRFNQGMNVKVSPLSQSNPRISLLERKHLINFSKYILHVGRLYLIRVSLLKVAWCLLNQRA